LNNLTNGVLRASLKAGAQVANTHSLLKWVWRRIGVLKIILQFATCIENTLHA